MYKKTINYSIYFDNNINLTLEIYSDADYACCIQTRRSTSLIEIGSSVISWTSHGQNNVSLSSTEAKYLTACKAIKGIIWLIKLIHSLTAEKGTQPIFFS